ncbi:hypothetical protein YC2023_064508 [Brassica napus]
MEPFLDCLGVWVSTDCVTLLLATDGSFDIGISHVMCWSIWIWAAVLILQSSEDACLAGGALYLLSQC